MFAYNFNMSTVDHFILWRQAKLCGEKLSGLASIGLFSPLAHLNTYVLKLFCVSIVLQMFVYFCLV